MGCALLLVLVAACGLGTGPEAPPGPPARAAGFEELERGDLQDQVRAAVGEPDLAREWAVAVPWWGPGEGLASELPLGSPVVTWSYRVDGQDYYLHFDAAKTGRPLLAVEVYPAGAVF